MKDKEYFRNRYGAMKHRCYSEEYHKLHPSYIGCEISEEFSTFEKFYVWAKDNFYQFRNELMDLDKDILVKGNKIYSPNTCIFVPQSVNKILTLRQLHNGNYPLGVYYNKRACKFKAQINIRGRRITLGCFGTPQEAHKVYIQAKQEYLRWTAYEYRDEIPEKLFNALLKYQIEDM